MQDAASTARDVITKILAARGVTGATIESTSALVADLGLDSLELAELSAALEDELGRDPFSEGLLPETFGELVAFYTEG